MMPFASVNWGITYSAIWGIRVSNRYIDQFVRSTLIFSSARSIENFNNITNSINIYHSFIIVLDEFSYFENREVNTLCVI